MRGSLLAQKLRLATLTQNRERIEVIHAELLKFSSQYPKNHFAEIQHSLMWAEAELFGLEKAMLRFQGAMESDQEIDRNLFSYDLLSIALKKGWKFRMRLPEANGVFESSLKDIFEGIENFDHIMSLSQEMAPGQFFRLLSLCKADPRASRMLSVVISGLSGPSRKLWSRDIVQVQQEVIEMTLQGDLLQFKGTRLDLAHKISHRALIKSFVAKSVVQIEELAKALGSEFYDLTQYDRVRIAVQRLNQDFLKLTGHKLLILDDGHFELNSVFKLQEV